MSKPTNKELSLLRKAFSDIAKGYTKCIFDGQYVYIRHLSHHEHVDLDQVYNKHFESARESGIYTEEQMMAQLVSDGLWDSEKDGRIDKLYAKIEHLEVSKRQAPSGGIVKEYNKQIQESQIEIAALEKDRSDLLGKTAEKYAEQKLDEYYIIHSFYSDPECTQPIFTDDRYDFLTDKELSDIVKLFATSTKHLSDDVLKKIALQDFFQMYFSLSAENPYGFFGPKAITDLTFHQVRLISYGRVFRNILQRIENIPDKIRDDPDKLMDYAASVEKTRTNLEKQAQKGHKVNTVVGATDDDIKNLGGEPSSNSTNLSAALEKAKKQGKKRLENKDLMEIFAGR